MLFVLIYPQGLTQNHRCLVEIGQPGQDSDSNIADEKIVANPFYRRFERYVGRGSQIPCNCFRINVCARIRRGSVIAKELS